MGPREFWTPGKILPEKYTEPLREGPTALKHHHIVASAFFLGQGHSGLILTQYQGIEWAVWRIDVYGNPELLLLDDVKRGGEDVGDKIRADYAEELAKLLKGDV